MYPLALWFFARAPARTHTQEIRDELAAEEEERSRSNQSSSSSAPSDSNINDDDLSQRYSNRPNLNTQMWHAPSMLVFLVVSVFVCLVKLVMHSVFQPSWCAFAASQLLHIDYICVSVCVSFWMRLISMPLGISFVPLIFAPQPRMLCCVHTPG